MISTNDLRRGVAIVWEGEPYKVLEFQHVKLGRGSAFVRVTLRNLRTGATIQQTFQAGTKFERARLETRQMQYLYRDGDLFYFMDLETYEQPALSAEIVGDAVNYMTENMVVGIQYFGDEPIGVELPTTVDLKVVETTPGFKGDTASGGGKPAVLETGLKVTVPFFVEEGDIIRVDTRTGEYVERVS